MHVRGFRCNEKPMVTGLILSFLPDQGTRDITVGGLSDTAIFFGNLSDGSRFCQ